MSLPASTNLGRYRIQSLIGAGGMGEVYLAEDSELRRKVAVKMLPDKTSQDETALKRLLREARAAATLDHPNICSIHEVGEADGKRFIVMQYVEGRTLDDFLSGQPLDLSEVLKIAAQLADALCEAHAKGVIHRDIKPANVMITTRGEVKVMDFGLAKIVENIRAIESEAETAALISTPGLIIGTLPYMSPEQVEGNAIDGRSDIFSVGTLVYEMVTGRRPFRGASTAATASAILTHEQPPMARYANGVPAELDRIVAKSLHKRPDDRYQTARDLLIDLRTLRDEVEFQHRLERSQPPDFGDEKELEAEAKTAALRDLSSVRQQDVTGELAADTSPVIRRPKLVPALLAAAGVAVAALGGWWFWRSSNIDWARDQIPQIEELAKTGKYFEAYDLAAAAEAYLPGDADLARLMPTISDTISVTTEPAEARVFLRRFIGDGETERRLIGTTPVANLRIARGPHLIYTEKEGFAPVERSFLGTVIRNGSLVIPSSPVRIEQRLQPENAVPQNMVFVPGGDYRLVAWERPTEDRMRLDEFFIDKYEVSNQDFKEFVSAGGYLKKQYWNVPFVKDGKPLDWESATALFKDRTQLPGPRNWLNQNFPDGRADHPVTDITWYEAMAYAVFRGKTLPTVFQWEKAARNGQAIVYGTFMPWGFFSPGDSLEYRANFENDGTTPVGALEFGMSPFGAFNMAGNVSEWTLNETSDGFIATGGGWGDPVYAYAQFGSFPGLFSSDKRGFRCVLNSPSATGDQGAAKIEKNQEVPEYARTSDAEFSKLAAAYRYHKVALEPQIIETTETPEWRREKIMFNAAEGERAIAYLYLPKNAARPVQVIHFIPAGDVENGTRSLTASIEDRLAGLIKTGRAVFGVVTKGYIERLRPEGFVRPERNTVEFREIVVNRITDVRRGLDYLETRNDVDLRRIGFYGPSAGSRIGTILAAVENRYAAVYFQGSGVSKNDSQAISEANPIKFAPHIRGPKMMLHGRYDEDTALRTQAEPLFKLLSQPKRIEIYDGGHVTPLEVAIPSIIKFFDENMGPVKHE